MRLTIPQKILLFLLLSFFIFCGKLYAQNDPNSNEKKDDEPKIFYVNVYFWFKDLADKTVASSELKSYQIFTAYANGQCSDSPGVEDLNAARSDLPAANSVSTASLKNGLLKCVIPFFMAGNYAMPLPVKIRLTYDKSKDDPITENYERNIGGVTFFNKGLHLKDPQVFVLKTFPIKIESDLVLELSIPKKEQEQIKQNFSKNKPRLIVKDDGKPVDCEAKTHQLYHCKINHTVTLPQEYYDKKHSINVKLNYFNFELDETINLNVKGDNKRFYISAQPQSANGNSELCNGYKEYYNIRSSELCLGLKIHAPRQKIADYSRLLFDFHYDLPVLASAYQLEQSMGFDIQLDVMNRLNSRVPAIHFASGFSWAQSSPKDSQNKQASYLSLPLLMGAGWFIPHNVFPAKDSFFGQWFFSLSAGITFYLKEFDEAQYRYPLTVMLNGGYEINFHGFGIALKLQAQWQHLKDTSLLQAGLALGVTKNL